MNRRRLNEKVLYRVTNGAVLACIGLSAPFLGVDVVSWRNILVLLVLLVLFAAISHLSAKWRGLCLLLAVICAGVAVAAIGLRTSITFLWTYIQWCLGYAVEQTEWLEGFRLVQTAVITATSLLIQILLERFRALKTGLAYVCAVGMLVCLFAQISLPHMSVVFVLFYIVVVYIEWLQEHWEKKKGGGLKERMLWLSPFLGVYLLLMAIMPAPETPYDWQWVKDISNQIKESFLVVAHNILRGGNEDFDTALSGFSDDGGLGRGVRENDREVMRLQTQRNLVTNVYLTGKVYDTFDGTQWLQEYHENEKERLIDTLETLYAVRRLDENYLRDYLRETNLKIKYEYFNTEYVFAPLKAIYISDKGVALDYTFEGGDLLFEKKQGYGTEYDVRYYQLNLGEELFVQLLEAHKEPNEELWKKISIGYEKELGQRITQDMLEAHRQMIYENYLGDVTLSKEAENYLSEITKDAETELEKLQAIEKELNSYVYTRTLEEPPDKLANAGEFLDYFLLESRQGYCTYFATAFVLLARAEGIPARYVQGFCVPAGAGREAVVISDMAHTWPEVYIDDVGWIPFEPTPGYGSIRYTPWGLSTRVRAASYDEEEELEELEDEDESVNAEEDMESDWEPAQQEPEEALGLVWLWMALVFCIPAILAILVLALIFDNLRGMYRYRRMDSEERLKVEVRRNLRLLSWLGLKREEQETLQELHEHVTLVSELGCLHFIEDYEDVVYGGKNVGEEMLVGTRKERGLLWSLLKKEKRLTYVFYRMWMLLVRYQ